MPETNRRSACAELGTGARGALHNRWRRRLEGLRGECRHVNRDDRLGLAHGSSQWCWHGLWDGLQGVLPDSGYDGSLGLLCRHRSEFCQYGGNLDVPCNREGQADDRIVAQHEARLLGHIDRGPNGQGTQVVSITDGTYKSGQVGSARRPRPVGTPIAYFDNLIVNAVNGAPPSPDEVPAGRSDGDRRPRRNERKRRRVGDRWRGRNGRNVRFGGKLRKGRNVGRRRSIRKGRNAESAGSSATGGTPGSGGTSATGGTRARAA